MGNSVLVPKAQSGFIGVSPALQKSKPGEHAVNTLNMQMKALADTPKSGAKKTLQSAHKPLDSVKSARHNNFRCRAKEPAASGEQKTPQKKILKDFAKQQKSLDKAMRVGAYSLLSPGQRASDMRQTRRGQPHSDAEKECKKRFEKSRQRG